MRITSGTFGIKGSAFIGGGRFHVESSKKASYSPEQILRLEAGEVSEKQFHIGRAVIGAASFGLLFMLVAGPIGALAGVIIGALGGFASEKHNAAEIEFVDGNSVRLICTDRALNKLIKFKG
ncbi:hypothetical protein ACJRW5_23380 [Pseudomonas sp. SH1-B]